MKNSNPLVIGTKGCGSVLAEAFLTLTDIEYDRKEIDYGGKSEETEELRRHNPLGQVPTLVLPNGTVLTESLGVAAYADSREPGILIPRSTDLAPRFWRWAVFMVAAVYPTFTYGDSPEKWVKNEEGAAQLRESTDEWRKKLWKIVEGECGAPYFLGETFSAIDVYFAAMVNWRPRRAWFKENCQKIEAIAQSVETRPKLKSVWSANFA
jgi:GST-like protein